MDDAAAADVTDAIARHNRGRDPVRLRMKYAKMRESPFIFLRGACHLFYDALPDAAVFRDAPLAWCCGDLHFENFGTYKGDNRQVYFDINDFDEAALAPASWDLARLLTSIACGADALNATRAEALAAARACVEAYRDALIDGKPLWVERETAHGLVKDLMDDLKGRARSEFLDRRTVRKSRQRELKVDGVRALPASAKQKERVAAFMDRFAASQPDPSFYAVRDVACRIAGTGSLGVERFVVLVEGKGSPDGNYLLDIKEAKPSALGPRLARLGIAQPRWDDEATRVVAVQRRMQAVNHAFLQAARLDGVPCIVKGLQASEDRVAMGEWGKKLERLTDVAATMGRVAAWDQLRASGRSGAATADALMAYARGDAWVGELLDAATDMSALTRRQWEAFRAARPVAQDA